MTLLTGSTLQGGKYIIVQTLGLGGFGITYEAEQVALHRRVAIKEFFMKEYCDRDSTTSHVTLGTSEGSKELVEKFRMKFIREAQMIAGLDNPHIIKIHDIFEENGTAYYVMPFLDGGSLADKVKENGPLPEQEAIGYIKQIGNALDYLHKQNILHLDVKPSNVLLNSAGEAVLIDFGISKHYDEAGSQTSTTPVGISKGFAPMEQYQQGNMSKFSPATDIYSLGATLYFLLTGQAPPEAAEVNEDGIPEIPHISTATNKAIEQAMSPKRKDRPQSTSDFIKILSVAITDTTVIIERSPTTLPFVVSENTIIPCSTRSLQHLFMEKHDCIFTVNDYSFKMIYVDGGTFRMGSEDRKHSQSDERPAHNVTVNCFFIAETVVTKQLWVAVMGKVDTNYTASEHNPMINVSYPEVQVFLDKLNSLCNMPFRLPTEAEWEFAARGGNKSNGYTYSGSNEVNSVARHSHSLYPVKCFSPNELGIYDMSGNVNEWCKDWYSKYGNQSQINPQGPLIGTLRVARGGSFKYTNNYYRVSFRNMFEPTKKSDDLGFRIAI